jgi:hypothetical protein
METPLVFVSYSHDSEEHKAWVLRLATDLRKNAVDTTLDRWDLSLGQDIATFMQRSITESNRVILLYTETYVKKAEAGSGGVCYERLIVTAELVQNIDTKKFIPVIRNNPGANKVPRFLGARFHIDFSIDAEYPANLTQLLREILGVPSIIKPPLGPNPFSGSAPPGAPARTAGPTGITPSGQPLLDEAWFRKENSYAIKGIAKIGLRGHMELRFGLHEQIKKSQIELLNAVRRSEIRTFGWPIGIIMENREAIKPHPYGDGIRAEVAFDRSAFSGSASYDFWALRGNGDFYLLQNLFEDERIENKLFFNTRIVRVTESLLFCSNLYDHLGVAPETRLSIRFTHRGLAGRELTSSSPDRFISPSVTREDESETEIVTTLGKVRSEIVDNVRRFAEPLFMLFDFKELPEEVYCDIVRRFEAGKVS